MGWTKSSLMGRTLIDLLPSADQAQVRRMAGKLKRGAFSVRDFLQVFDAHGNEIPCRAVLGHHNAAGSMFFLGVVSLELPDRLKMRAPNGPPNQLAA